MTFTPVTKKQCTEFGQVAILVCLYLAIHGKQQQWVITAFIITLSTILVPLLFYPLAVVWFGLSKILGRYSPLLLLGLVFFIMVVPMGFFRRLRGIDSLKIRQFKKGRGSVMTVRSQVYSAKDLKNTF